MRSIRYFRVLEAWQVAMELAVRAHNFAATLPAAQRFELGSQIRRSASSVPSNIAEGHAHRADRVFLRHVNIALGSLAELDTDIELAGRLNLVDQNSVERLRLDLDRVGQLLHGLRRTLRHATIRKTANVLLLLAGLTGVLSMLVWA